MAAHLSQFQQQLKIRLAAGVDLAQLRSLNLVNISNHDVLHFDEKSGRINASIQEKIGAIVVSEKPEKALIDDEQIFALWQVQLEKNGLSFLNFQQDDKALLLRWQWINLTQSQHNFPDVSECSLISKASIWLKPFISNITTKTQLQKLNVTEMLLTMLDYQQQKLLKKLAPSYYVGPTGRKCSIRYSLEETPIVSLPMQEVYGLQSSPVVGEGKSKINVTFELLSPAQRPIQVTSDLARFWQGSYKEVQKDMKAKYPKHYWPDDPANAEATNKTKKHILKKN